MNEDLKAVEKMVQRLEKDEVPSPWMHVAIGGLRTFLENGRQHLVHMEKCQQAAADLVKQFPKSPK
jgi:hypothetical protein